MSYVIKAKPEDFVVTELPDRMWLDKGEFLVVKVTKTNRNTEDVVAQLVKQLRCKRTDIVYAGLKDKHAVTSQFFSVRDCSPSAIEKVVIDNVSFEIVGYTNEPLSLGSLQGNAFEIVVRNIDVLPKLISCIPNFFGEQRFSDKNDAIGRALVKKDFAGACALLDDPVVFEYLENNPSDVVGALRRMSSKSLRFFIHAYQSRLFNDLLEEQLEERGLSALEKVSLPILGFGTVDTSLYESLLEKEDISPRDFIIRQLPDISTEGVMRDACITLSDLRFGALEDDDLHPGKKKCVVSFSLPKGSYATTVIKFLCAD